MVFPSRLMRSGGILTGGAVQTGNSIQELTHLGVLTDSTCELTLLEQGILAFLSHHVDPGLNGCEPPKHEI